MDRELAFTRAAIDWEAEMDETTRRERLARERRPWQAPVREDQSVVVRPTVLVLVLTLVTCGMLVIVPRGRRRSWYTLLGRPKSCGEVSSSSIAGRTLGFVRIEGSDGRARSRATAAPMRSDTLGSMVGTSSGDSAGSGMREPGQKN